MAGSLQKSKAFTWVTMELNISQPQGPSLRIVALWGLEGCSSAAVDLMQWQTGVHRHSLCHVLFRTASALAATFMQNPPPQAPNPSRLLLGAEVPYLSSSGGPYQKSNLEQITLRGLCQLISNRRRRRPPPPAHHYDHGHAWHHLYHLYIIIIIIEAWYSGRRRRPPPGRHRCAHACAVYDFGHQSLPSTTLSGSACIRRPAVHCCPLEELLAHLDPEPQVYVMIFIWTKGGLVLMAWVQNLRQGPRPGCSTGL